MSLWTMADGAAGKPKHLSTAEKNLTFGVDTTEMTAGSDNIVSITVSDGGSGYASAPSVTVAGAGTATATVSGGKVTAFTITAAGSSYTSPPAITVAAPAAVTFNGASGVDDSAETITLTGHPFVTGDQVTYSDGSGTAIGGLTDGGTFFVIKVDANTIKLATTLNNANAGTAIDLTDGVGASHTLTGETATGTAQLGSRGITHAGWNRRTEGTGGRAGRVFYECLVAASSISGDASDDAELPDS